MGQWEGETAVTPTLLVAQSNRTGHSTPKPALFAGDTGSY